MVRSPNVHGRRTVPISLPEDRSAHRRTDRDKDDRVELDCARWVARRCWRDIVDRRRPVQPSQPSPVRRSRRRWPRCVHRHRPRRSSSRRPGATANAASAFRSWTSCAGSSVVADLAPHQPVLASIPSTICCGPATATSTWCSVGLATHRVTGHFDLGCAVLSTSNNEVRRHRCAVAHHLGTS